MSYIATCFLLYFVVTEILDWTGRMELIQKHFPRTTSVVNNRAARILLMLVAIGLLAKVWTDRPKEQLKTIATTTLPNVSPTQLPIIPPKQENSVKTQNARAVRMAKRSEVPTVKTESEAELKTNSVEMHVASGGVGSVNQTGGITAGTVYMAGADAVKVTVVDLPGSPMDKAYYGSASVRRVRISLSGAVPLLELYAFSQSPLIAFSFAPDVGFTAQTTFSDFNGGKSIRIDLAFGPYVSVIVSAKPERPNLKLRCTGVRCAD